MADLDHGPALVALPVRRAGVSLTVNELAGQVILRGDAAAVTGALRDVIGCALPIEPCRLVRSGDVVAWLAPDRWLVASHDRTGAVLTEALRTRLASGAAIAHDVTDGLAVIDVAGSDARTLLAAACGLDLHPRAISVAHVARTLIAGVDAVVYRVEPEGFRLHVGRPVAHHAWSWLSAALDEFAA